jgi:hypothetical protein
MLADHPLACMREDGSGVAMPLGHPSTKHLGCSALPCGELPENSIPIATDAPWNAVSAFAVAHVRGSYVPITDITPTGAELRWHADTFSFNCRGGLRGVASVPAQAVAHR